MAVPSPLCSHQYMCVSHVHMYMYMYGVQGCVDGCVLIESVLTGVVVHFHFEITTTAVVAHMTSPWCCATAGA